MAALDITDRILANLESAFFGEEYFKHLTVVAEVLKCRSLKDFRALKLDCNSPEFRMVFSLANHKPVEDKMSMTQARAEQIFAQVKTARAVTTFI